MVTQSTPVTPVTSLTPTKQMPSQVALQEQSRWTPSTLPAISTASPYYISAMGGVA